MRRTITAALALLALGGLALTHAEPPAKPDANPGAGAITLGLFAFLAGHWRGELDGTPIEEVWLAPERGNMTGVLRWFGEGAEGDDAGALNMAEIFTLDEVDDSVVFRIRHLNADLSPWASEADAGPMVAHATSVEGRRAVLTMDDQTRGVESVTYDAADPGHLKATIAFTPDRGRPALVIEFDRR